MVTRFRSSAAFAIGALITLAVLALGREPPAPPRAEPAWIPGLDPGVFGQRWAGVSRASLGRAPTPEDTWTAPAPFPVAQGVAEVETRYVVEQPPPRRKARDVCARHGMKKIWRDKHRWRCGK